MKYTVIWREEAETAAAELWADAIDRMERREVGDAIDLIDRTLKSSPYEGESRSSVSERILWVGPIAALYDIDEGDCNVEVIKVWHA